MSSPSNKITPSSSKKDDISILTLGPSSAGKTTAIHMIKTGEVASPFATIGVDFTVVPYQNLNLKLWELGGRERFRTSWHHYFRKMQAFIFVIDSSDKQSIYYAFKELQLTLKADEFKGKPLLVLANKQDLPNAMSVNDIIEKLQLQEISDRKWHVQPSIAIKNEGLKEGMDWVSNVLVNESVGVLEPLLETVNDSKLVKDGIFSMFSGFNLKSIFAKFGHY